MSCVVLAAKALCAFILAGAVAGCALEAGDLVSAGRYAYVRYARLPDGSLNVTVLRGHGDAVTYDALARCVRP